MRWIGDMLPSSTHNRLSPSSIDTQDLEYEREMSSQRQNGFFCFFFVEVVLRVTKANQASPRSKMGRSLQW